MPFVVMLVASDLAAQRSRAPRQRTGSPPGRAAQPDPDRLAMDSAVTVGTLPNGLRYYLRQNGTPANRVELRLVVDAGSVLEDPRQRGLAHFVEHMAFNGTTHFGRLEIVRYLESMGMQFGADLNATTTFDETTYLLTIPTDRADALRTGIRILGDWAHGVRFDSAAVEVERGIVLAEWRTRGGGTRSNEIDGRLFASLLRGSRYVGREPIGEPEIIRTAPRSELLRFYRDWYRPDRMAVVVVGDIDVEKTEAMIRAELGAIPPARSRRAVPPLGVPAPGAAAYAVVSQAKAPEYVAVNYWLPRQPRATRASYRQRILQGMIAGLLGSRLADLGRGSLTIEEPVRGVRMARLQSSPRDGDVRMATAQLLAAVQDVVEHGFTATELGQARAAESQARSNPLVSRDQYTSAERARALGQAFLTGGVVLSSADVVALAEEHLSGLQAITLDELNAAARALFATERRQILVLTNADKAPITEGALAGIADSVARSPVPPFETAVASIPLVRTPPAPGRVDSVRSIAIPGASEWVLSNGAHVVILPNDYNPNQVLVGAQAPGGTSLAADSDFVSARFSIEALASSGLGELGAPVLRRRAGSVTLTTFINELSQGVSASTTPRDLDVLFQLMYLAFTAPRYDSTQFEAWRTAARQQLAAAGPDFGQQLRNFRTGGHPRTRPIIAAMIDSVDPWRALAFRRARFADASAFTFYIVGAFKPDSIRPLVERWVASLPATNARETWRDVGIREMNGPGNAVLTNAPPGRTLLQLLIAGDMPSYDAEQGTLVQALSLLAQRRLYEKLRNQLGATYAVQASYEVTRVPITHFNIYLNFDAAPAQADSLRQVAIAELDTLRVVGPTAQEVAEVKALDKRTIEGLRRDNGFLYASLVANGWNGFEYGTGIVGTDAMFDRVLTQEKLRQAAARYLDTSRLIRITVTPAKQTP